jgi:hypothetical protein
VSRTRLGWAQVDPKRQDSVDQLCLGISDHGEISEVTLGLFAKALTLGALYGWHAPRPHGLRPLPEPRHHLLGVERRRHRGKRRGLMVR